jgi:quercetin 2,3-dioxygenase
MDRKTFLKKGITGASVLAASGIAANAIQHNNDELEPLPSKQQVGFNHLPNINDNVNNTMVVHRADTRGQADHGWLKAKHTFSFANYYNPERMHFGVLRVLNDDCIAGGMGFGTHPHDNMEIITIPLEGTVAHRDSMGNSGTIQRGEVQVMSAGTGIQHSEFNHEQAKDLKLLQIWLFPNKQSVTPRYDQLVLPERKANEFQQILSPSSDDAGVWIHQNAWFNIIDLEGTHKATYTLNAPETNGVYAFVISGEVTIAGQSLKSRDGLGIWDVKDLELIAGTEAEVLLMEVPMHIG